MSSEYEIYGGSFDVILILRDPKKGSYHPAFFRERPFPGPRKESTSVRLAASLTHTEGFETLEEAQASFDELVAKVCVPEENRWRDEAIDSEIAMGMMVFLPNWRREGAPDGPWNAAQRKAS